MFDINLFIYQVKMFIKRLRCDHNYILHTKNEDFYIQTCMTCGKQKLERKVK
ncbi:hypothetical protein vBVpaMR16F_214 [Vibrio phage vB_VpaM_R16F]|nr:hypothetical protein vBVpaMR16F_214 [Vibrio phage vB_VpaM_R16F]